jgi:ABC-2 type transport system permease protein
MSGLSVIGSFLKKEFRQILRSREMLIVLFALPAMQLLVMGFAVTNEVKNLTLSFFDYDNSPLSRNLCASFSQGDRFRVVPVSKAGKPEELLFRWQSKVVIVIPQGFARDVYSGRQVSLQVISDGSTATPRPSPQPMREATLRSLPRNWKQGKTLDGWL